jgi:Family of unknown function (DUF6510)
MRDTDLRLDGNAAAGLLTEIFTTEMTTALGTCAGCGATNALATTHAYVHAPGTVLRCPACTALLICIVRTRDRLIVDMSGLRRVELPTPTPAPAR